jgi:hypothetical protein
MQALWNYKIKQWDSYYHLSLALKILPTREKKPVGNSLSDNYMSVQAIRHYLKSGLKNLFPTPSIRPKSMPV